MEQSPGQPSPSPGRRTLKQRTIVVLGARGVGKSASVIQYVDDHFVDVYSPTIESTFRKSIRWRGEDMVLSIRDTSGQDEHTVFHPRNCNGVHGFIIMYSVTSRATFRVVEFIRDRLLTNLLGGTSNVPLVLVGNKNDLDNEREVSEAEGRAMAQKWGCPFVECSAKHNDNVGDVFHRVLVTIHRQEDGDLEEPGCCEGSYCSCDLDGTSEESQRCIMRLLNIFTFATLLFGVLFAATGFGHHQRTNATVAIMTYSTVGLGLLMVLASCVGLWGVRSRSVAMLRGFGVTLCALLVAQVALAGALLDHPSTVRIVARSDTMVAAIAGSCCVVQVGTIVLAFIGQRVAQLYPSGVSTPFRLQRTLWQMQNSSAGSGSSKRGGRTRSARGRDSSLRSPLSPRGPGSAYADNGVYGGGRGGGYRGRGALLGGVVVDRMHSNSGLLHSTPPRSDDYFFSRS